MFVSMNKTLTRCRIMVLAMVLLCTGLVAKDDPPPGGGGGAIPNQPNWMWKCDQTFHCAADCDPAHPNYSCVHYLPPDPLPKKCKHTGWFMDACTPVLVVCAIEERYSGTTCVNNRCADPTFFVGSVNNYGYGCNP